MDHWLLPCSRNYGKISCYTGALDRVDLETKSWWKRFKYDMHQKARVSPAVGKI
jgi:hypothetical protein